MAETVESPGRRRLSPPAAGARPQQRDRPGLPVRAGPRRAATAPGGQVRRARAGSFIRRHRLGPLAVVAVGAGAGGDGGAAAAHGGGAAASGILATAANRSLVLVVRDAHRGESTRDLVTLVLADRPDTVLVEMGLPVWQSPAESCRAYVAT